MTPKELEIFERTFGFPVPSALKTLLADACLREALPVAYHFSHVGFLFEIRYRSNLEQEQNYEIHAKRLVFAMDTDGYDLLVDLSSDECQLMLRQFGEADHIGLTIQDLLDACRTSL